MAVPFKHPRTYGTSACTQWWLSNKTSGHIMLNQMLHLPFQIFIPPMLWISCAIKDKKAILTQLRTSQLQESLKNCTVTGVNEIVQSQESLKLYSHRSQWNSTVTGVRILALYPGSPMNLSSYDATSLVGFPFMILQPLKYAQRKLSLQARKHVWGEMETQPV